MNRSAVLVVAFISASLIAGAGCGKKPGTAETTASKPAAVQTPAAPAPHAPAAAGANSVTADTTAKLNAADWAIKQDEIKNDPDGQWATTATASSTYNDAKEQEDWSPYQLTGIPNVERYGDDGKAWAPKTEDSGIEWIDLKFDKPVFATEVRVRESCGSGAIIRLELFDESGAAHTIWADVDPTKELNYLIIKFPKTTYKTNRVKLTLATNAVQGWNEIDAVQLVGKAL